MCWFEAGITKSSGKPLAAAGLGLLHGSLCVHYNNEPERRAAYLEAVGNGMPGGYGLDDYAGLLWEGEGSPSAITARRGARAYRVCKHEDSVSESPLPARFLPAPAPAALREDIAEFRRIKSMRKRARSKVPLALIEAGGRACAVRSSLRPCSWYRRSG
jgi:hypothetical protein